MHHPAASIIGSRSVIHDVADIPHPIRIPFSCNGGEHSWNYRVGCITSRTDCTLFKPCFKTIKGFFPFNPEIWKEHSTQFKCLNGVNCICRHNSNSNILKEDLPDPHGWRLLSFHHSSLQLVFDQSGCRSWLASQCCGLEANLSLGLSLNKIPLQRPVT